MASISMKTAEKWIASDDPDKQKLGYLRRFGLNTKRLRQLESAIEKMERDQKKDTGLPQHFQETSKRQLDDLKVAKEAYKKMVADDKAKAKKLGAAEADLILESM